MDAIWSVSDVCPVSVFVNCRHSLVSVSLPGSFLYSTLAVAIVAIPSCLQNGRGAELEETFGRNSAESVCGPGDYKSIDSMQGTGRE